jgi:hypothetical protein
MLFAKTNHSGKKLSGPLVSAGARIICRMALVLQWILSSMK